MANDEQDKLSEGSRFTAATLPERREKTDWVTYMATALSIISWCIAVVAMDILNKAQPQTGDFFSRVFGTPLRDYLDTSLVQIAFYFLLASFFVCVAALVFNLLRKRRKTDKMKKSILSIFILTVLAIVYFIYRFGHFLFES